MFNLGFKELVILGVIFIVLFGTRKIPMLAQSLVDAIKTLRKGFTDDDQASSKKK